MQFVLHVGLPKTGTTSIQFCLKQHRDRYRRRGVIIPTTGQDNLGSHLPLIRALGSTDAKVAITNLRHELADFPDSSKASRSKVRRFITRLYPNRYRHDEPRVLISSEKMYIDISLGRFDRILDSLREAGAQRFAIIMYLRSPYQLVNSIYAHQTATFALKGLNFSEFAERLISSQHKEWRAQFNYQRVIEIAQRDDVNLILRPYNNTVAEAVYLDFLESLNLKMASALSTVRFNTSFGPASIEAMRVVGGELGYLSEPQWRPLRAFAENFAKEHSEQASYWGIDDATAASLSQIDHQTEKLAQFAWRSSWRDVIGDERRPLTIFEPSMSSVVQTKIYESMLDGLRRTAQNLSIT